jgi:uncharacterized damage-inducible protein DinB
MGRKAQFREAWEMNEGMNRCLLDEIGADGLSACYAPRARSVRRVFVHIHNMRLHWLGALAHDAPQLARLKSREAHDVETLRTALTASGAAIITWLCSIAKKENVKIFEHSPMSLLSFMIAHEAHHRGQIIVAMRLAGKPLARETILDLWDF